MPTFHRSQLAACAASILLAACGGGGGGGSGTTPLTLSGTAATGAAIAGAPVEAKCASGTGSASTKPDGSYSIEIAGGSLPCVLEVRPAGGAALHSVIDGSGAGSVNVNITPLTELVVAKLAAGAPSELFTTFDAAAQAKLTTSGVNAALGAVTTALQGAVDLAGINPIKDPLVAANGSTTGDALDQKLDALQAVLGAAQTTLAELTTAVATSGDTAAPVQTILKPAATSCAGLRSGNYVAINPNETDPAWQAHVFALDAATLTATFHDASSVTLTDDGGCAYSVADDGISSTKVLVSKSGLAVSRDTFTSGVNAGKTDVGVVIPAQAIPLSELTGSWSLVDYFRDTGMTSFVPGRGLLTVDAAGKVTAYMACDSAGVCMPESIRDDAFSVNASGGFNVGGSAAEPASRAFAFKTADGHLSMFVLYSNNRGMMVLTKQSSLPLPPVGAVLNAWDFVITSTGFASPLVDHSSTVTAVDAATGTFTLTRASDNRVDSFKNNDPQTGFRHRATNSCTANGAPLGCAGIASLPLPGTGVIAYISVAPANFFGVAVSKP